jgi:hypothetical protein
MGTRNLTMVVKNGEIRVAQYGGHDGYPEGQGSIVFDFITKQMTPEFSKNIDRLQFLTDEEYEIEWPNRHPAARILLHIQNTEQPKIWLRTDFAGDSLYCEWAYLVDLDNSVLEVYTGGNTRTLTSKDRFFNLQQNEEYYKPIKLLTKFTFDELRNNFPNAQAWADAVEKLEKPQE